MRRVIHLATLAVAVILATAGLLIGLQTSRGEPLPTRPDPALALAVPTPVLGVPASTPRPVGEPTRVVIPRIGVSEELSRLGLENDGAMTMPAFGAAGWYAEGPPPGAAGPAVVVAHVRGPGGPDVFWDLADLTAGDRVTVHGTQGRATFVVVGVETVDKDALPYARIWPDTDLPLLRLITCGGDPDPNGGGFPANTIVYARLA